MHHSPRHRPAFPPELRPGAPLRPAPTRSTKIPEGTQARGFALYVGLDEEKAAAAGTSLLAIVEQLKALLSDLAPAAQTYAAVAVAAEESGGRDIEVVRRALHDRSGTTGAGPAPVEPEREESGVLIDISRKRVTLDGQAAALTFREFELLQFLVLREGRTMHRQAILESLWSDGAQEPPHERTIDVHVRRLRSKLGAYEEIIRTVRGGGYASTATPTSPCATRPRHHPTASKPESTDGRWVGVGALNGECLPDQGK